MAPDANQIRLLQELITSTGTQLAEYIAILTPGAAIPALPHTDNPPHPLHVLRDAAQLVKAHTTKLGLLAINAPFTPSAVRGVLSELATTCIPAMMSASHICHQQRAVWGAVMAAESQARVRRVFRELEMLLDELRAVARESSGGGGNGSAGRRDSLSSTGVVWESCDAVVELARLDVAGLAVQKAEQWRDTIKDAIEELREWKEGEDLDSEGLDELLDDGDEGVEGDRDSIEDIFNAANSMPKDRPELKKLVDDVDGKLKKVVLLYTAVIKRRLKIFKVEESDGGAQANIKRLDKTLHSLRRVPNQVDDLASCFYDLDEERVKQALSKCIDEAISTATTVQRNWQDTEDEFTTWSGKWKEAMS
ncbi:hypothetical protein B0A50_08642 [Salinomyces thailandicus]|uniref:Uncharacterized protein n=1 Tax=Salinomyces thailandicus TaxID=706561 RepID=A0A4U0TJL2_9PEZI|nr:hypothetical protein B0A50_08642 [Salinomyces thailandica]